MFDFLKFIRTKYAEYNNNPVRQGTMVDELAVKPTGLFLQDFYNTLVQKQKQDNIDNWAIMTEDELDYLGNKFFFPRIQGNKAFGSVRIWINDAIDVTIGENFKAVSSDGLNFLPTATRTIQASSFILDNSTYGKYYFDVGVVAEFAGSNYNKAAGDIQSLTGVDFVYSYVTNPVEMVPGQTHETNEFYQERIKLSLNDRSLMNKRSLYAGLKQQFPFVYSIFAAGAGNKYMTRDRLQAVDLSSPPKVASYLGKIAGDTTVKHTAYWDIYPAEAGTRGAEFKGPISIYSEYTYPQTVEAVDLNNDDPAYHGYPLYQEASNEMYQGLYFDDFRTFMNVETSDLLNIDNEVTTIGAIPFPNSDWLIAAHGRTNGDYAIPSDSTLTNVNIVEFNGSDIFFKGGTGSCITAQKNIYKRTGVKITGTFTAPASLDPANPINTTYFVVGGPSVTNSTLTPIANAYLGFSFGIRILSDLDETNTDVKNAFLFFASNKVDDTAYFVVPTSGPEAFSGMSAFKSEMVRIKGGSTYSFEITVKDDLGVEVYIDRSIGGTGFNDIADHRFSIDGSKMDARLLDSESTLYGSMFKITLDTESLVNTNSWKISNIKVSDIAPHRPTAMYMFNVDNLEEPLNLVFRGSGSGAIGGNVQAGHSVYIWNLERGGEISGTSLLSSGGWEKLEDVSDPTGTKDIVSQALSQTLTGIDKYKVASRFGTVIIIMVVCEGTSSVGSLYNNNANPDINASLSVDYIKLEDRQTDVYRGNNKVDVYVNTLRNVDNFRLVEKAVTKTGTDTYITVDAANGFEVPVASIDQIIDTDTGTQISSSEYSIIRDSLVYLNSTSDEFRISIPDYDNVTIRYSVYNDMAKVQDFFDGEEYGKVFGDVLVKHKFPMYLDFELFYRGETEPDDLIQAIRSYFDERIARVFDVPAMVKYLYDQGLITYINQPITVNYTTTDENLVTSTGSFTESKSIREIDFFRIRNITASLLS